ncbi:hypothetical protein ACP4OV_020490 [Aristida adscensionis]
MESSTADGSGRTLRERILLLPENYIGSVERCTQKHWVLEHGAMARRPTTYVPGLDKIFDEVLVHAAGNKQRDPAMDSLRVEVDVEECRISVYYNGTGVPVQVHREEGVYMPEMVFGDHLAGSCDDSVEIAGSGGRSNVGVNLANIFSTEFTVETADGHRRKKYKQVFSENMGKKSEPQITECLQGENWTRVTFKPDLDKFNMSRLEDDVVILMKKRVVEMAAILGITVQVEFNSRRVPINSFLSYINRYIKGSSRERQEALPRIHEKVNDQREVCLSLSEGQFEQISFVNKIATTRGGTHIDYVSDQIASHVVSVLKELRRPSMTEDQVKSHFWVFVNVLTENPTFDSPTREALITPQGSLGSTCQLSDIFLRKGLLTLVLWANCTPGIGNVQDRVNSKKK